MRALDVDISKSHVASTSSADLVFPLEGSSGSHVQNARSIDDDTHRSEGRLPSVQEPLGSNGMGKCYRNCKMTCLPVINRICIESSRIALRPDQERDETSAPLFEQIPRRNRGKATQLYFLTKPLQ